MHGTNHHLCDNCSSNYPTRRGTLTEVDERAVANARTTLHGLAAFEPTVDNRRMDLFFTAPETDVFYSISRQAKYRKFLVVRKMTRVHGKYFCDGDLYMRRNSALRLLFKLHHFGFSEGSEPGFALDGEQWEDVAMTVEWDHGFRRWNGGADFDFDMDSIDLSSLYQTQSPPDGKVSIDDINDHYVG